MTLLNLKKYDILPGERGSCRAFWVRQGGQGIGVKLRKKWNTLVFLLPLDGGGWVGVIRTVS